MAQELSQLLLWIMACTVFKSAGFVCLALAAPLNGLPCTNDGVAQDVSGGRVPAQADLSYTLALTQSIDLPNSTIDVRLSRKYVGQMYGDIWNTKELIFHLDRILICL
jgi:hypothetical protein